MTWIAALTPTLAFLTLTYLLVLSGHMGLATVSLGAAIMFCPWVTTTKKP